MTHFFLMGGYALYVWSAYVITAGVLIAQVAHTVLATRKLSNHEASS